MREKKGMSVPTLISAVWLLRVRRRGWEITLTSPCCCKATSAALVSSLPKVIVSADA